MAKLNQNH